MPCSVICVEDSDGGSVRVMSRKSMEDRALIRGFTGRVLDLSFAHGDQILLAAIDENGALLVHLIDRVQGSLVYPFLSCCFIFETRFICPMDTKELVHRVCL